MGIRECEHILDSVVDWTGYLVGYQRCCVCSKQVLVICPEVYCNRNVKHCGYRLPDGTCVPISRYGYLFDCFMGVRKL